jgi:hypothetical protein
VKAIQFFVAIIVKAKPLSPTFNTFKAIIDYRCL